MTTPEAKAPPTVEYSQKYMSWHLKEINQSLKDLCTIMRSIDLTIQSLKDLCTIMRSIDLTIKDVLARKTTQVTQSAQAKPVSKPNVSEEIPF